MGDSPLGVAAGAFGRATYTPLAAAQAHGALELGGQRFELFGRPFGATGVAPCFGAVALRDELGEPGFVLLSCARVDHFAGIAAIDAIAAARELEHVELASRLGDEAREHLHAAAVLDVNLFAEAAQRP